MSRKKKLIIGLVIAFLLGGASGGLYFFHFKPASSPISAQLKKQVPFQIYYPSDKKYKLVKDSLYYDSSLQLLYMKFQAGTDTFTVTEQAKPAGFTSSNIEGTQFLTSSGTGIIITNVEERGSPSSQIDINRVLGISGILICPSELINVSTDNDKPEVLQNYLASLQKYTR